MPSPPAAPDRAPPPAAPDRAPPRAEVHVGNARGVLDTLRGHRAGTLHGLLTSPPYYRQRRYPGGEFSWPPTRYRPLPGHDFWIEVPPFEGQLGWEPTDDAYLGHLLQVLDPALALLRPDAAALINLGDSLDARRAQRGLPGRLGQALAALGWATWREIVWHKPNPAPSPGRRRPTVAHESVLLIARNYHYFWDADAIRTPHKPASLARYRRASRRTGSDAAPPGSRQARLARGMGQASEVGAFMDPRGAAARDVWTIPVPRGKGHPARMPPALVDRALAALTSAAGACARCGAPWTRDRRDVWSPACACPPASGRVPCVVLDPFAGDGTTGRRALAHGRSALLIESAPEYAAALNAEFHGHHRD